MSKKLPLIIRKKLGKLSQRRNPGMGYCVGCGMTWNSCTSHNLPITDKTGCFILCEDCNDELTPAERLPHYMALIDRWESYGEKPHFAESWDEVRRIITRSVKEGL